MPPAKTILGSAPLVMPPLLIPARFLGRPQLLTRLSALPWGRALLTAPITTPTLTFERWRRAAEHWEFHRTALPQGWRTSCMALSSGCDLEPAMMLKCLRNNIRISAIRLQYFRLNRRDGKLG
jgi:hypothetical protein